MTHFTDIIFHLDEWLYQIATLHPIATYAIFLGIVFTESAFFPMAPFLPGDGLLFAVGVLAASGAVHVWIAIFILIVGGILGNWVAYQLGRWLGPAIFDRFSWLNRNHYQQAHEFYQRYGSKTLVFSRFVPVIRALVPFVAGIAGMSQKTFTKYNIIGVVIWVLLIVLTAYHLGHIPFIKNHFIWVVFGLAGMGLIPMILVGIRKMLHK